MLFGVCKVLMFSSLLRGNFEILILLAHPLARLIRGADKTSVRSLRLWMTTENIDRKLYDSGRGEDFTDSHPIPAYLFPICHGIINTMPIKDELKP